MSKLIVEVVKILEVQKHSGADRLDLLKVKGWQVISNKLPDGSSRYKVGDLVIYIPPDAVLTSELAEKLEVTNYCSIVKNPITGGIKGYKVKGIRLRGEPSYGLLMANEGYSEGDDVAETFGITKWEPPPSHSEDGAPLHPLFHKYSDPEHYQNYPDAIPDGTRVVITEKIHGRNGRAGMILVDGKWELMAGSHNFPRKEFGIQTGDRSIYWAGVTEQTKKLFDDVILGKTNLPQPQSSIILFHEIYGLGMQDMHYGRDSISFAVFDIAIDGNYVTWDQADRILNEYGIPSVPVLFVGEHSSTIVKTLTDGPTLMCDASIAGTFKGREGVVVKPYDTELVHPRWRWRVILKSVSADYLARKGGTDGH